MKTLESLSTGNDTKRACFHLVERLAQRFGGDDGKKKHISPLDKNLLEKWKREGLVTVAPPCASVNSEKSRARYFYRRPKIMETKPCNPDVTAALQEILAHIGPRPHGYIKSVARKHSVSYQSLISRYYAHFTRLQLPVPRLAKKEDAK